MCNVQMHYFDIFFSSALVQAVFLAQIYLISFYHFDEVKLIECQVFIDSIVSVRIC